MNMKNYKNMVVLGMMLALFATVGIVRGATDILGNSWSAEFTPRQDIMVGTTWYYTNRDQANVGVGYRTIATAFDTRTYVKYNISALTNTTDLTAAKICWQRANWAYFAPTDATTFGNYHVYTSGGVGNWNETVMNFANQPCGTAFSNTTACNTTAEDSIVETGTGSNGCLSVLEMLKRSVSVSDTELSIALRPTAITGTQQFTGMYDKEITSGEPNTTIPLTLYINCSSGCVGLSDIPPVATTTILTEYTPEWNEAVLDSFTGYIGQSLGLSSGQSSIDGGKFLIWVVLTIGVVIGMSIFLASYNVRLDLTIIEIIILVMIGLGVILGWIPLWIGVLILLLGVFVIVRAVSGFMGGVANG